jgi:hypothetical protein
LSTMSPWFPLRRSMCIMLNHSEIVSLIEATGAMGLFHEGYASVSKKASQDYLDRVFVDMMWYKAFSIYLVLRRGINVLFQDVDLVWFRDPMPYFHDYRARTQERSEQTGAFVEAFFSDDGQRSMRYTPFYANSGFYYLVASERSTYFAWSIMAAMDAIQVLGEGLLFASAVLYNQLRALLSYPEAATSYPTSRCWDPNVHACLSAYLCACRVAPERVHDEAGGGPGPVAAAHQDPDPGGVPDR